MVNLWNMRFLGGIFLLTVCLIEIFLSGSLQFYVLILVIFSISVISEVLIKKYDNLFSIMFGFLLLISVHYGFYLNKLL
ncbi:MAG: hypothetical protein A4E27_01605 [Methanobacterium sp. PtaU1.Bin242]|jgi:hypothetical protein|nr:MAG: hypothetical protein A4E27_01605 [Methanobacterium sp. PtaU1.Bin242]